jgi:regulator of replication initiation timing
MPLSTKQQTPQKQTNMSEQTPEHEGNRKLLVVGLIIVLLSINGILFYMQHQTKKKVEQQDEAIRLKNTELEDRIKQFEALKADFERQSQELQGMGLTNDSLQTKLAAVEADLNKLRSFRKSSFSVADQKKFKERAANFEVQLKKKDEEIARLKEDNEALYGENTTLKTTQNQLNDTIVNVKRSNQTLSQKVAIASRLEAEKIKITTINQKGKEREDSDEEFRAKRVDKIKVTFRLAKNDVAEKENKEIMMRLIEPDGAALYNLSTGSGTFNVDGKETFYTAKRDIVFDNSQQEVSLIYAKGSEYKRGLHTIELYSEGSLIGKTTFTLK